MANQWFRFYAEFASDPKVQMMPETFQRRLMMLFCFRCNGNETLQDDEIVFQLRVSPEEWQLTKAEFIARNFIDNDNRILNWDKRQYVSDSSTARVSKHREKKKQECNVTVTPPEQNRADTEQSITERTPKPPKGAVDYRAQTLFDIWWQEYPHKIGKGAAEKAYEKALKQSTPGELLEGLDRYRSSKPPDRPWCNPATWLNQQRWKDEPNEPITKNGKYTDRDALNEVLADIDSREKQANSPLGSAVLRNSGHLRQIAGTVENIDAGDDRGLERIPSG